MPWEQPGRLYRALRKAKGLKQREVGELLGVKQEWVSQIENGRGRLPSGWSDEEERRVHDEEPWRWDEQPVDRTMWDDALALGEAQERESRPLYAIGFLRADGLPVMAKPPIAVRDRDAADAVAEELALSGVDGVAVVPVWASWIREHRGTVPTNEPRELAVQRLRRAVRDSREEI